MENPPRLGARRRRLGVALTAALGVCAWASAQDALAAPSAESVRAPTGALFDAVAAVLGERLVGDRLAQGRLDELVAALRPAARAAAGPVEERGVVQALLEQVPVSHLALLSSATHRRFEHELRGRRSPMLGCHLLRLGGRFFLDSVYDGGPAARAGLRRGDEVLAIDGVPPGRSPVLDWRSDDASLPDPALHDLRVGGGRLVTLRVADPVAGDVRDVEVRAARWSGLAASVDSVRALEVDGHRVLYVHLWFVFHGRSASLLRAALDEHPDCEALLLDLRGRGGSALECPRVVREVELAARRGVPTVALIDARTRSAKEVIASELQQRGIALLVGERTAGAVLPASFVELGSDAVLMLPEEELAAHSRALEGRGVTPEVQVSDPLPPAPGVDHILDKGQEIAAEILQSAATGR
ncbi:MAG: S41 family peptidase [Planctomycetota bacterium]